MGMNLMGAHKGASQVAGGNIQALSKEMFEKTQPAYYNPLLKKQRGNLLESMLAGIRGVGSGGFASSGARQRALGRQRGQIRTDLAGTLAESQGQIGQAKKDISDIISTWVV